jgi:hypothetical protein
MMEVSLPDSRLALLLVSPPLADLVMAAAVAEGVVLTLWHRRTGRGLDASAVARMLLPGVCLMFALRAALSGTAWPFVPVALTAALVAHLADLRGRWRG